MRKILSISVIAFILAACDTYYWTHPGQWHEKYTEAATICQEYVRTDNESFPRCMSSRGWSQSYELLWGSEP